MDLRIVSVVDEGLGHSSHVLAYLLLDASGPVALFSGGSLMVGTIGRTDLLGDEHSERLARDLFGALRDRIMTLPDDLAVYPTHGAGSFCSAPGGGDLTTTTTIGRERATNPLLAVASEDELVDRPVDCFGSFLGYFRGLPALNRTALPYHRDLPPLAPLEPRAVAGLIAQGAIVVDARPGAGHVELGSIPAANVADGPLASMCGKSERAMTAASILRRAGHDDVAVIRGGFTAWSALAGHQPGAGA
jgi:rhodanese-related sulfurtransferase